MPSNRRPGPNRQPTTRRPKVAGLRNRDTPKDAPQPEVAAPAEPEGEGAEQVAPEVASAERAEAGRAEPAEPELAETERAEPAEVGAVSAQPFGAPGGVAAPASTGGAEPAVVAVGLTEPAAAKRGVTWGLWIATAVLAALAAWFGIQWYSALYTGAAANEALVSAGATSEVNGQITDAVEKLFSYDFNDTAKTENAARDLLVGPAVQRYNDLFAVVKQQAPLQQLIVTTTVKNSAVTRLQDDRAELLLFVDQHAMRANTGESNTGPAQLSVSAEKQGDQWKISQITLR
ncbi:hypothetical protein MOQ72_06670 [Saccharopolyspora sp. K220]|uniref:hypothetical protein n=1 Tax=Saccharopolyspora soli TaxID=2926618 RepID=UPI001F56E62C|nr:hypothetical protein [Saccharopolyspora soli]MCI2417099.1 hypothetical protein [Saccharopolyspora soli]